MILEALEQLARGPDLDYEIVPNPETLRGAMRQVMDGEATSAQLAGLLMGLRCRGEQAEHLREVVAVMLEKATPIPVEPRPAALFDTCGTGGDQHGMVNVSTAAGLLAGSFGLPVAKHGNRSVSSKSGSADVLEALGYKIDLSPERSAQLLAKHNFCFLFAPLYHGAMKHAGPTRRELKMRTIFNLAGPLSNPARASHQLVGVSESRLVEPVAKTLQLLGAKRALVVYGRNGEDEISLTTMTEGLHLREDGRLEGWSLDPLDMGLEICEMADLVVDGPEASAAALRDILAGKDGPMADLVNLSFAATLFLADRVGDMYSGFQMAQQHQRSGAAAAWFEALAKETQAP